jgi:hypothetical protein
MIKNFDDFSKVNESNIVLTKEQVDWLNSCIKNGHFSGSWRLNAEGQVDVNKDFICENSDITDFKGIEFGEIKGTFDCRNCKNLISLKGAPRIVGRNFLCYGCHKLTSLIGAPDVVGNNFDCSRCDNLISLTGAPIQVGLHFLCYECPELISFRGGPYIFNGTYVYHEISSKISKEELKLADDKEIFKLWLKSGLPVKDFLEKKKGMLQGRKYGI